MLIFTDRGSLIYVCINIFAVYVCVCGTRHRRRLAGLVGDGLGDFPDLGVESWLPAVPLAKGAWKQS